MRRMPIFVPAIAAALVLGALPAGAAPRTRGLTHTVTVTSAPAVITSTVSGDAKAVVDFEFFGPDGSELWHAGSATLGAKVKSASLSYTVPCPAGAGEWQVHYQAHNGGRLVGSDTQRVTITC